MRNLKQKLTDYRVSIIVFSTVFLSGYLFYILSRLEKLKTKSAISPYQDLSFSVQFSTLPTNTFWEALFNSTYNWIITNREGMLFGIWIASLLSYYFKKSNKHKITESIFAGAAASTVLGLCVNCAVPLLTSNKKNNEDIPDFLKGIIVGSHTFNFVIIVLMFTILPLEYSLTKILSILIILFIIRKPKISDLAPIINPEETESTNVTSTFGLLKDYLVEFVKLLGFALKEYVFNLIKYIPLMIIAGLIGNLVYITIPHNYLFNIDVNYLSLAFASLVFSIFPVPLSFDVIITAHLLKMNIHPSLAMAILLTLGSTSVLVMTFIGTKLSFKKAFQYQGVVVAVAILLSSAHYTYLNFNNHLELRQMSNVIGSIEASPKSSTPLIASSETLNLSEGDCRLKYKTRSSSKGIRIEEMELCKASPSPSGKFQKVEGEKIGLEKLANINFSDNIGPLNKFLIFPAAMASGDYDQDHWEDVLITTFHGLFLYKNNSGANFLPVDLKIKSITPDMAIFFDVDNDGFLDIVVMPYNFAVRDLNTLEILYNDQRGNFRESVVKKLDMNLKSNTFVNSIAVSDVDGDGALELFAGMYTYGDNDLQSNPSSTNYLLKNLNQRITLTPFTKEAPGETMSSAFTDLNQDGHPDLIVGNDYNVPDYVFLGSPEGVSITPAKGKTILEKTSKSTMSIVSSDMNNDGIIDLYFTDMSNYDDLARDSFCSEMSNPLNVKKCRETEAAFKYAENSPKKCAELSHPLNINCALTATINLAKRTKNSELCSLLQGKMEAFRAECITQATRKIPLIKNYFPKKDDTPQTSKNLLLINDGKTLKTSQYQEQVAESYWAWNTIIEDFDNDGWKDIYVVNGDTIYTPHTPKVLFRNKEGMGFERKEKDWGLDDYIDSRTSLSVDFRNIGVLDIINGATLTAPTLYLNPSVNKAVQFELRDEQKNHFCIGCKIQITTEDGKIQLQEVKLGGGFRSFNSHLVNFGLGKDAVIKNVAITWSDNTKSVIESDFKTSYRYKITRK